MKEAVYAKAGRKELRTVAEALQAEQHRDLKLQRVLLIDLGAHFGGVENYLVSLAQLLEGEVDLYALCVLPELARRLNDAGAKTTLLPTLGGGLKPLRFVIALILLPFLILRHRIQIIQVNGFLEATLMLPARLLGCRTVYTRHGPFEMENYRWYRDPLKYLPRLLARISVHLATEAVCVSETVGIGVRKIRPRVNVTVIPNWLAGQDEPQELKMASAEGLRLVCASRLERYKGIHLVIEAMRDMVGVQLTVVGDGPYRAALEEMANGLPVEFVGFQKDMAKYYGMADIFIMPSLGPEGLPMSSLEAMGRGLPCVLSDLPVHKEITNDGKGALLFEAGSTESLRKVLQEMVDDPASRAWIASEGYQIVGERYTADSVRKRYVRVFGAA